MASEAKSSRMQKLYSIVPIFAMLTLTLVSAESSLNETEAPKEFQTNLSLPDIPRTDDTIAVLVIACNRITVSRCLDQVIKYRPSEERFPIIVSQDCAHQPTSDTIDSYKHVVYHIHQPDQSNISTPEDETGLTGYYKIARHYKWALNVTFNHYNFSTAIVVEDDLDIAPDFYEYFTAALPILKADPTLWCVSAYNDNGRSNLIDKTAIDLLYRTDFFPGLGWMLTKSLWTELAPKWPATSWDDWMREPAQRKNRSCIRPEVSRTKTFGEFGVSHGQYYNKYLRHVFLNEQFFNFTRNNESNLSYLMKDPYDRDFLNTVRTSPIAIIQDLFGDRIDTNGSVQILYDYADYKGRKNLRWMLNAAGLMKDFKSGILRTAYLGIVSFFYRERRVYLAPKTDAFDYNPNFST